MPRSPRVREWLESLDTEQRADVDEAIHYLEQHGVTAAMPDVKLRIQTSRHYPDMGEVRVDPDADHLFRVLFCFDGATPVLLVGGNKASRPRSWYEDAVPLADQLFDEYLRLRKKASDEEDHRV